MTTCAVVLAAGQGSRMASALPKVLLPVGGQPMVLRVLRTVAALRPAPTPIVVVVGHHADAVRAALSTETIPLTFAYQRQQLGTGHAVLQAAGQAAGRADNVLVLYGDTPLLATATLRRLLSAHESDRATVTLLAADTRDPTGYGRLIRDTDGRPTRIVEEAHATASERAVREINVGVYAFRDAWLWPALEELRPAPGGEVYLTDLVARALSDDEAVSVVLSGTATEAAGVNTPEELTRADSLLRGCDRSRVNPPPEERGVA